MNDEDKQQEPAKVDFGSLDQIMMLMIYGAANLIEKTWSVGRQAARIAEFNACFMNLRAAHEESHTTKHSTPCPFCAALKLNANLNRETAG